MTGRGDLTRRSFLRGAIATSAPMVLPARLFSAQAPSGRITMGFIGMGKQSRSLLGTFLWRTQVLAVCDVDTTRREDAVAKAKRFYEEHRDLGVPDVTGYNDFRDLLARKDLDAICIATPDHWHAIQTIASVKSGRDVYCEKPLTHNIHEAIEVMKAVAQHRRVLQTGSMQRSSKEFRIACELVRNGVIGKIERVECSFGDPAVPCDLPAEPEEPGLDWNLWLGPAPMRPYNSVLSPRGLHDHFPHWRRYREYGGGMVTDWGAHHLDIAQWGLGMDESGPVEVRPPTDPNAKRGATLIYANGVRVIHKDGFGVHFFGSEGEVKVNRGKFELIIKGETVASSNREKTSCAAEVAKAERMFLANAKVRLYESKSHSDDFLARMRDRGKPIASEVVGARTAICCHLMNLAYYHRQVIRWDPGKLEFAGSTGDPTWLTRNYRSPWRV
ncbi:MAG: Gfo/Idh/MocA family oxidoreductase [Kiritimatiellae bacterium]|nr:Gfo/Idh/MocA family oxidoreductase [Kiritimatiellia bacterium]